MVNKTLIDKIISVLMVIDLALGLFFLAILLTFTLEYEGGLILDSPYTYIILLLIFVIPVCYIIYYLIIINTRYKKPFVFNRASFLTIKEKKKEKKNEEQRFPSLSAIDNEEKEEIKYDKITNLKDFCDDFQSFCATIDKEPLYYDISDIRAFIANLGTSKLMILQGMSGTGKTSIAIAFEKYVGNVLEPIAIQPMWKEKSDLVGYFNEFTKKFNETLLLNELYHSRLDNRIYIIILDELNIARIEYYFADFLSRLEVNEEQRYIEIVNDTWPNDPKEFADGKLLLGKNVFFLGTANNDESTFAISDKVYDRAMIINLNKKATPFKRNKVNSKVISYNDFESICEYSYKKFIKTNEYTKTNQIIAKFNYYLNKCFNINFGNRMSMQIFKYVPIYLDCGGTLDDALDDFITKKVLRKIESMDFLRLNDGIKQFLDFLNDNFDENSFKNAKKYLSKFLRR